MTALEHLTPLTPISYLARSARVFGDRLAVSDGELDFTYSDLFDRSSRLAGMMKGLGVERGDRVAFLSPNNHVQLEAHFGIPASGASLVAMNNRLNSEELARILTHSESKVLVYDSSLRDKALEAENRSSHTPELVEAGLGDCEYETLLARSDPLWIWPASETDTLSINYTSGTTGEPKGVVYHHRGAFLQALAMAYHAKLDLNSVYLWTLPMFHTNGWCFPWAVTAAASRHLCLRTVEPEEIWRMIRENGVTHLCAAPTVLLMLASHDSAHEGAPRSIRAMTGGAPPPPSLIERLASLNIDVIHLYGLTETFGPAAICDWRPEWDNLPQAERARLKARQGVENVISTRIRVIDVNGQDVPDDGATIGEIAISGNNLMSGYFNDPLATEEAMSDGWFRTGDLAVMHPNSYVEIVDRKKDVIISGGENVSSVQVEQVLATHPAVYEAAVVAAADEHWGEVPIAFVELNPGWQASEEDLIAHVRSQIAHFKAPKRVYFEVLPRTSTGKIQKHRLRRVLESGSARNIVSDGSAASRSE